MANYKFSPTKIRDRLIEGLETLAKEDEFTNVVIDMSLPNAFVALAICVRALGKENVCAAFDTREHDREKALCQILGVEVKTYDLDAAARNLKEIVPDTNSVQLRARLRAVLLRCIAETLSAKLIGTLDLNKFTTGNFTSEGENVCDYAMFGELTTIEVIQIGQTIKELPKTAYEQPNQYLEEVHHYVRNDQPLDICIWRDIRRLESGSLRKRMLPQPIYDPLGGQA